MPKMLEVENSTNVYRTNKYIVCQKLTIEIHSILQNFILSQDTYYKRTRQRDKEYEKEFGTRLDIDGKRLKSTSYTRKYID